MSECGPECECKKENVVDEQVKAIEQEKDFDRRFEELLRNSKGDVSMGVGAKFYLDKMFKAFTDKMAAWIDSRHKIIVDNNEAFKKGTLEQINPLIQNLDKRFSNLYGTLVHKFLVKQEARLNGAEIAVKSLFDLIADRLYAIEMKDVPVENRMSLTDYAAKFKSDMDAKVNALAEDLAKRAREDAVKAQAENEVAKESVPQEAKPTSTEAQNS